MVPLRYNLRNLFERKGSTLMTAIGIGLTVAVLVTSIAMSDGMAAVFAGSGNPQHAIVLRKGADAELSSNVSEEAYNLIRALPGIATTREGQPMVSPEALTVVILPSVENTSEGMNISVRGVREIGVKMREGLKLTSGRWNEPGKREIVAGEGISRRYPTAQLGQTLRFGKGDWKVVGTFTDGDSAHNSELWTDLDQLRGDFEQQGGSSSVLVRLVSDREEGMKAFTTAVENDQQLKLSGTSEKAYYKKLTESSSGILLQFIGVFVSVVMAIGAGFAATNTMYAAVARRTREIGTLRALGFTRLAILTSFVFESICLALVGGVIGCLIALPLNNLSAGIGNWQTFSEMAFKFQITPKSIAYGLLFAATIGFLGGLLPAWSAARKGVIAAMRDA